MELKERFMSKVDVGSADECWDWQACKDKYGYGKTWAAGKGVLAHRLAYELFIGAIPSTLPCGSRVCVCHTCDRPQCVNPAHLFLGTHADNMRDKNAKGRQFRPVGNLHHNAKLDWEKVIALRAQVDSGSDIASMARKYRVDYTTAWRVAKNIDWKKVDLL